MKKILVVAGATLVVNLLAGLLLTAYPWANVCFTSVAILVNTLFMALLFGCNAESTHRLSLGIVYLIVGVFEYFSGLFAPSLLQNNWWVITFIVLTAIQVVLTFLAIHYAKKP